MDIASDLPLPVTPKPRQDQGDVGPIDPPSGAPVDKRRLVQFRWLLVNVIANLSVIFIDRRYLTLQDASGEGFAIALALRLFTLTPLLLIAIAINRWSQDRRLYTFANGVATVAIVVVCMLICRLLQEPLASRYMMGVQFSIYGAALFAGLPWRATLIVTSVSTMTFAAIVSGILQSPHDVANLDMIAFNFLMAIFALYTRRKLDEQMQEIRRMRRVDAERTAQLRQANGQLAQLSRIDALTGAFNRRHLDQFAEQWPTSIVPSLGSGLLMIDVDHFKLFNDHAGHLEGDRCLERVAGAIRNNLRSGDDFVVRYGGEEFVAILPSADLAESIEVADRVRRAISDLRIRHPGLAPGAVVTVSIGVSVASPDERIFDAINRADQSVYAAKKQGRNRIAA